MKAKVKFELAAWQLNDLYFELALATMFDNNLSVQYERFNEIKDTFERNDLIFGKGSSHIWIADKVSKKRYVLITFE